MNPYYKDYGEYLSEIFPGRKIQKISVNAGFSCPNRDGTIGRGGCIYCDNTSFTPSYCFEGAGVTRQIEEGKKFFSRKYPAMRYLVYFQSYTNTFARASGVEPVEYLRQLYTEALSTEEVEGLIIGSRPDCFDDKVIRLLAELNQKSPIFVEIGAESSFDLTLRLINRGHDWTTVCESVQKLKSAGLHTGLHLIMGLPGETREMMLETVSKSCDLGVETLKFHHLQIIRDTPLHRLYDAGKIEVSPWDPEEYMDFCQEIVGLVPRHIAIERFLASSPSQKVVAPKWGMKNYEFTAALHNLLKKKYAAASNEPK